MVTINIKINNTLLKIFIIFCFVILEIVLIRGAPLPTVGGDSDTWGTILNAYLQTQHNSNGSHTNITSTGINVTGDFLVNNASGDKAMSTDVNGNLNLTRGIILGNFATKPSCAAGYLGMMVFDTANDKPYVCAGSSIWKPLDSDYDLDGLVDWFDSNDTLAAILNATSSTVRIGYTFVNNSGQKTGSISDCSDGGNSCYANSGAWALNGDCDSQGDQSCRAAGSYFGATTCSGTSGQQTCYAGASGEWHDNECSDSTTSTTSECYVDDTAKFVDADACSAASSTGNCYMNTSTFPAMDGDLSASNIKSGTTIFGILGTLKIQCYAYGVCTTDWCTLGTTCSKSCSGSGSYIDFSTSGANSFSLWCRSSTGDAETCYLYCTPP